MSKSKQTTKNTPGFAAPPDTGDIRNLRDQAKEGYDFATPLRNQYARAEQQISRSYNNPLGGYTTADVRGKTLRANKQEMGQNLGMDLANAAQQSSADKFNRQSTVANLTQPRFYNASSTTTQPFTFGDGLGLALGGASGALS